MNEEIQDANSTTDPSDSCAIRHDRKKHARTWMPVAAKVLLVIAFVYGTASCLVLGLNINTDTSESTRSDAPVSDVPITQARAETLGLLLSVYDALDTRADIGPWIPPAPGARDAVRQADQEESFDEHSSCPEGTVSERYRLATTPVTKQKLTSSHAYTLIDDLAEPYGFPRSGNGYTRSTDGASVSAGLSFNEDSFVVSITTRLPAHHRPRRCAGHHRLPRHGHLARPDPRHTHPPLTHRPGAARPHGDQHTITDPAEPAADPTTRTRRRA